MHRGWLLLFSICAVACSTFDEAKLGEGSGGQGNSAGTGGSSGKGGAAGQGGAAGTGGASNTPDGSTCQKAIDLTVKNQVTTTIGQGVFAPSGTSKGSCGGGELSGTTCGNPPERWFKYTLKEASHLVVTVLPQNPVTYEQPCTNNEYGAVLYAQNSCGQLSEELGCASFLDFTGGVSSFVPARIKIAKAGDVYFAVDGRLSDSNVIEVTATTEPICASDADCKILGRPVCDKSSGVCHECLTDTDCKNETNSRCDNQGKCVACVTNSDCKTPENPVCSPYQNQCVGCVLSSDCKDSEKPVCVFQACTKSVALSCNVPQIAPSAGSCVQLNATYQCNPITNAGCSAGLACDFAGTGFQCYGGNNTIDLCQPCDGSAGLYCKPGNTCLPNAGKCTHYCCSDEDCGGNGVCDKSTMVGETIIGVCLAKM